MKTRRLGRTNLQVSEIGYGAWGIGKALWVGADDQESLRALHRAVDLGVNFIDTALAYGPGHSERLVGQLVRERQELLVVASKVPPKDGKWPASPTVALAEVFPGEHIVACCESSLRNTGLETLDLLQLHVWHDAYLGEGDWLDAFDRLKRAGKVRFVGISINDHDPASALKAVASGIFDTVQVIYNIFDPTPAAELFPLCLEHDVGVLARVPLDEGGLTGVITPDSSFAAGDFRSRYFKGERKRQVHQRAQVLESLLGDEAATLAELALRFCLSHPAVSSVIPGMRSVGNVERNTGVSDGRRLSPGLLDQLCRHAWPRNFYQP